MEQDRAWATLAGVNGALAVAAGAVAAHALAADPTAAGLVDKAARYQLVHAVALLGLAALAHGGGGGRQRVTAVAGSLFTVGIVLFCGSLYLMGFGGTERAPLAPVGGTAFILGWLTVAAWAVAKRRPPAAPPRV